MQTESSRWQRPTIITIAVIGLVVPLLINWLVFQRVPEATPETVRQQLAADSARVVDVRTEAAFEAEHLDGAVNWPFAQVMAVHDSAAVPEALRGRELYLICDSGHLSALATRHLQQLGIGKVYNVAGGMQAWIASAGGQPNCGTSACMLQSAIAGLQSLPYRDSPGYEQWAAFLTGFVVKPLYMILSLVLVVVLWRSRARDLTALRWSLLWFFVGEAWCAVNYLAFGEESELAEFLHSYGMVMALGFATYALLAGADDRLIRFSAPDKRCAAIGLCGRCVKQQEVPCGFVRVFMVMIPAAMVMAFLPLCAQPQMVSYNTTILESSYNYSHAVTHQLFEIRYCPAAALVLFAAALIVLLVRNVQGVPMAKLFFAAGMGGLGFGYLRLILFAPFRDNLVWFGFWEEITELLFVLGVICILWIFRARLFPKAKEEPAAAE